MTRDDEIRFHGPGQCKGQTIAPTHCRFCQQKKSPLVKSPLNLGMPCCEECWSTTSMQAQAGFNRPWPFRQFVEGGA